MNDMDMSRKMMATVVLSGMLASGRDSTNSVAHLCRRALAYADELISICDEPK